MTQRRVRRVRGAASLAASRGGSWAQHIAQRPRLGESSGVGVNGDKYRNR